MGGLGSILLQYLQKKDNPDLVNMYLVRQLQEGQHNAATGNRMVDFVPEVPVSVGLVVIDAE